MVIRNGWSRYNDIWKLKAIYMNHADDFAKKGIAKDEITDLVMTALNKGEIVGYQRKGTGRPIYKVTFNGEIQGVAITVGNNGFIVGANLKSLP